MVDITASTNGGLRQDYETPIRACPCLSSALALQHPRHSSIQPEQCVAGASIPPRPLCYHHSLGLQAHGVRVEGVGGGKVGGVEEVDGRGVGGGVGVLKQIDLGDCGWRL
jgi:hypothetical protein